MGSVSIAKKQNKPLKMQENKMDFLVERYKKGDPFYSDAVMKHTGKDGVEREYQAIFGQILEADGGLMHYTMERLDTLIPEGEYEYSLYRSPSNRCVVILLHNVPHYSFIEHHPANWPWELKGCTSHGLIIDIREPMINRSGAAFLHFMGKIKDANPNAVLSVADSKGSVIFGTVLGKITYRTFNGLTQN